MEKTREGRGKGGCLLWIGSINRARGGYGQFRIKDDGRWRVVLAHRFAFEAFKTAIPEGMEIDHLCNNPACVNPQHLQAVDKGRNLYYRGKRR
jgi:hypothetical protein